MAKFLFKASYSSSGAKGLSKEGGTGRRAAVQKITESVGGKLEAFYFAFGDADAYVLVDLPDATSALAVSMVVNGSDAVRLTTVPLLTPEEVDQAAKRTVSYRAPGA